MTSFALLFFVEASDSWPLTDWLRLRSHNPLNELHPSDFQNLVSLRKLVWNLSWLMGIIQKPAGKNLAGDLGWFRLLGIIPSFGKCSHPQFHVYWIHCLSRHPLILGPGLEGPSYNLWICKTSLPSTLNWLFHRVCNTRNHAPSVSLLSISVFLGNHRICLAPFYPTWVGSSFRRCSA